MHSMTGKLIQRGFDQNSFTKAVTPSAGEEQDDHDIHEFCINSKYTKLMVPSESHSSLASMKEGEEQTIAPGMASRM